MWRAFLSFFWSSSFTFFNMFFQNQHVFCGYYSNWWLLQETCMRTKAIFWRVICLWSVDQVLASFGLKGEVALYMTTMVDLENMLVTKILVWEKALSHASKFIIFLVLELLLRVSTRSSIKVKEFGPSVFLSLLPPTMPYGHLSWNLISVGRVDGAFIGGSKNNPILVLIRKTNEKLT